MVSVLLPIYSDQMAVNLHAVTAGFDLYSTDVNQDYQLGAAVERGGVPAFGALQASSRNGFRLDLSSDIGVSLTWNNSR